MNKASTTHLAETMGGPSVKRDAQVEPYLPWPAVATSAGAVYSPLPSPEGALPGVADRTGKPSL